MRQKSSLSRTWVCAVTWRLQEGCERRKADLWVLKAGRIPSIPGARCCGLTKGQSPTQKHPGPRTQGAHTVPSGAFPLAAPLQPQHGHWAAPALSICGFPCRRARPCPVCAPHCQGLRWFPEASPSPEHHCSAVGPGKQDTNRSGGSPLRLVTPKHPWKLPRHRHGPTH